jgi:hypothetical protein
VRVPREVEADVDRACVALELEGELIAATVVCEAGRTRDRRGNPPRSRESHLALHGAQTQRKSLQMLCPGRHRRSPVHREARDLWETVGVKY